MKRINFFIILFLTKNSKKFKIFILRLLYQLKYVLKAESEQTKKMLEIYIRTSYKKVSKKELRWANKQLRDTIKTLGIGAILILPLAPITLPFLVKLGTKFDIDILPESVKEALKTKDNN